MRTLLCGAVLTAALFVPAAQASAQCCAGGHEGHAMSPATASGGCCGAHAMTTPAATMPCCDAAAPAADDASVALAGLGLAAPEAVQVLDVTFRDPVKVADKILMGAYRIEHDNDRMARGEPCTYIYARDDLRLPVVTFHCEHLERPLASTATVVLAPTVNVGVRQMTGFQFAGETAVHAVPDAR